MKRLLTKLWFVTRSRPFPVVIPLVFICLAAALYALLSKSGNESEGISLLKKNYESHRLIESRIAGFDYSPFITTRGEEETAPDNFQVNSTEGALLAAVYETPGAQSHHALGVFHLLNKRFAEAVKEFEKALSYDQSSARLQNDMGAALLEKGKIELEKERLQSKVTGKPIEDLSRSVEHIHKALDRDASLKEGVFNLGLAQEHVGLRFAASDTMSKYIEMDANSGWAYEARESIARQEKHKRASSLSKEELLTDFLDAFDKKDEERAWDLVCKNRNALNGKYISELLVDSYIDQALARQEAMAAKRLSALFFLADLEVRIAGEHYSEKLIEFYKEARRDDLSLLRKARDLVRQGHDLYIANRKNKAIASYTEAKVIFEGLKDRPESTSAEYTIAFCYAELRNRELSLPVFERLAPFCEREQFKVLHVRNLLSMASAEFSQQKYSKAIRLASQSLAVAHQTGDELSIFRSLDHLMEFYRAVGNHKEALACVAKNLKYSDCPSLHQLQKFGHFSRVANALLSAGHVHSSLEYRKEVSQFVMLDVPIDAAIYLADLGATYTKLKKFDEASAHLSRSYVEAQAISDQSDKRFILAYTLLHKGTLHKERQEFQEALSTYTEALSLISPKDRPGYAYQARKGRLFSYIALGQDASAEAEIVEALKLLEDHRSKILELENSNTFFDAEQDVYDLAIDGQISWRKNFEKAFDYSEESRARFLYDFLKAQEEIGPDTSSPARVSRSIAPPLTLQAILKGLLHNLQIIQYAVLGNKVVIWVLSSSGHSAAVTEISQEELNKKVRAYVDNISHYSRDEAANLSTQSKELFDVLVSPISHLLSPDKVICIVPDKVLNILPFEALISTKTENYLFEDFAVSYSPSASVLLNRIEVARDKDESDSGRMLGVGNPNFDASLFRALADLPAAEREIEEIKAFYGQDSVILKSGSATEERVRSEMQKAAVIHFAAHSVLDEDSPLRSKILLTKEESQRSKDGDGVLESSEIYSMKLPSTRLAVLSSCQSGIDLYYKGEGMMSLARSFMAAGVPMVVASLWNVDSNATADLMIEFHRLMREEKLSVVESLRRAKRHMLKDKASPFRHPYFWSAFIAIGGQANY